MIELEIHELELVFGGNGSAVTNNVVGNIANIATSPGGPTWGDVLAIPAAAGVAWVAPKNAWGSAATVGTYNLIKNGTNDAINAPPYNGRPIFEIEHGLTKPASPQDRSGNNYTDGTNYC